MDRKSSHTVVSISKSHVSVSIFWQKKEKFLDRPDIETVAKSSLNCLHETWYLFYTVVEQQMIQRATRGQSLELSWLLNYPQQHTAINKHTTNTRPRLLCFFAQQRQLTMFNDGLPQPFASCWDSLRSKDDWGWMMSTVDFWPWLDSYPSVVALLLYVVRTNVQ
jgi:hypothetical protein